MEYVYAALILHETGAEINESNLTAVLESADADVTESRIKAVVAALEDVDLAATKAQTMTTGEGDLAMPADDGGALEPEEGSDGEETADSLDTLFEDSDESVDGDGIAGDASDDELSPDADEDTASDDETGA